jgi:hypothetical protein
VNEPLPERYGPTRDALHRLAVYVISPARRLVDDQITLRSTPGGFGTPEFGSSRRRVRVDGTALVIEDAGVEQARARIGSLADAAALAGIAPDVAQQHAFDVPPHGDLTAPLAVDADGAAALAAVFAFAADVLEALRAEARPADDPTPHVRIWPEHFDAAVDLGDERAGQRATYGVSPGDRHRPDPYVYVSAWAGVPAGDPFWNAAGFPGAWEGTAELGRSDDPRAAALGFLHAARERLRG